MSKSNLYIYVKKKNNIFKKHFGLMRSSVICTKLYENNKNIYKNNIIITTKMA